MNDGLDAAMRERIRAVLRLVPRVRRAVLFGSRAMGSHRPASDIDLALEGEQLATTDLLFLYGRLEALELPLTVDLVLRESITNPAFEDHIARHGVEWYRRDDEAAYPRTP